MKEAGWIGLGLAVGFIIAITWSHRYQVVAMPSGKPTAALRVDTWTGSTAWTDNGMQWHPSLR